MENLEIYDLLIKHDLKITPQRIAVYKSLLDAGDSHPTADEIYLRVQKENPSISRASVYRILDMLVDNGLALKALTKNNIMKYDPVTETHHHLYFEDNDVMVDYEDKELDELLADYFNKKKIEGFEIKKFKLYIEGISLTKISKENP